MLPYSTGIVNKKATRYVVFFEFIQKCDIFTTERGERSD